MTHRAGLRDASPSFGYHLDSGPSLTAVFALVDNGDLADKSLSMNKTQLNHATHPSGKAKVCGVITCISVLC